MKPIYIILITLAVVVLVVAGFNYDKIMLFFNGNKNPQAPAEGTPCATAGYVGGNNGTIVNGTCVATPVEGSDCTTSDNKSGIINNGVCKEVAIQHSVSTSNTIKITKSGGAPVYNYANGNIVSPVDRTLVPEGTVLAVTQYIRAPHVYYNTASGWIDSNDSKLI